jgi:hypothetical protein
MSKRYIAAPAYERPHFASGVTVIDYELKWADTFDGVITSCIAPRMADGASAFLLAVLRQVLRK